MNNYNYLQNTFTAPVYDVAIQSPLQQMPRLSQRLGQNIWAKREDLQPVFSFKLRGAYTRMYRLNDEERARGVICSSAGNHAQGVALSANRLNIKAIIVMPVTTPSIKIDAVKRFGGEWVEVVLHGDYYDEASQHAKALQAKHGYTYIHPFDDPDVITGQGTVGLELLSQHPHHIDAIFVPVGGGGLLAGIAILIKQLRPDIRIIGVEPSNSASMTEAVKQNERITLKTVGLFAEGVAVKQAGELTFSLIKQYVDEFVTVSTDEICAAMKDLFEDNRALPEPSGAVSLAGLKKWASQNNQKNQTLIHVVSGANLNFDRLRYVTERAEIGEQREALLAVTIPEKAGSFLKICQLLGDYNITEFNYRYQNPNRAEIFVGIQLENGNQQLQQVLALLKRENYECADLTDNELAKSHLRYMIGGVGAVKNERLFRFGFPEKRGALLHFLQTLGSAHNISLFHYRNHGSDYGRILVGIESQWAETLNQHLEQIGYFYQEETHNPAYQRFLLPNND